MFPRLRFILLCAAVLAAFVPARLANAQTIFVRDTFTAGANTMLEAHTPDTGAAWTRYIGNSGVILNGAADNARNVAANDWNVYANGTTAPASEVVVGATVTFTNNNANNFVDLFGRASVALLNGYLAEFAANGAVTLERVSGGTITVIATGTTTVTLNTQISFVMSLKNAAKEVWINGVKIASSTDNTVTALGVTGLGMQSNVAAQTIVDNYFASTFAPTAVARLDARATRDTARTLVEWSTARETDNLGFRVDRDDGNGRVAISNGLIAGAAFMVAGASLPGGNTYRFIDTRPPARRTAYWIEEVDIHGRRIWHGPIAPVTGKIDARIAPSPRLADLGQHNSVAATHTRFAPTLLADSASNSRHRSVDPSAMTVTMQRQLAANGDAFKIAISADGLYRVTRDALVAAGLDPSADLAAMQLYIDGSEVPVAIEDNALVFYARSLDTPATGTRIAWLVPGNAGRRMTIAPATEAATSNASSFTTTVERSDKLYFLTFLRDPNGDCFVGPVVSSDATQPTTQSLDVQHLDPSSQSATLTVTLQGASDLSDPDDGTSGHSVAVSLNGNPVGTIPFDALARPTMTFAIPSSSLVEGANTVSFVAQNGDADASAVVSVALTYQHTFAADDDRLLCVADGGAQVAIGDFDTSDVRLLDITNDRAPLLITPTTIIDGIVTFVAPGSGPRTILAVASSKLEQPSSLVRNQASSLRDATGADVVMIANPAFVSALAPLVALRQSQGLSVVVATTDDIYDEFNFGAKDPAAIRTFLQNASMHWQKPPRYVLLVGDASFDERNYLGLGDFDFVPTKLVISDLLETASDTWFTDFDDDGAADVPIGRLPVRTLADAATEVDRIVAYESGGAPASSSIMFVSDNDPQIDFHANAVAVEQTIPPAFQIIDVDSTTSGALAAHQQILGGFGNALLVDYVGHGSVETWSNDSIFGRADVNSLAAGSRPPIVLAMTCLNGYFHDVYTESLAEALLRAPNGAVAVWASSSLTSPEAQLPVNEVLMHALLDPATPVRIGDAIVTAQKSAYTPDLRTTFLLFGDPAMSIARPK